MKIGQNIPFRTMDVEAKWTLLEEPTPVEIGEEFSAQQGLRSYSGELRIETLDKFILPSEITVHSTRHLVVLDPSRQVIEESGLTTIEFELYYPQPPNIEDSALERFEIWIASGSDHNKIELKLPTAWMLDAVFQILDEDDAGNAVESVCEIYNISPNQDTISAFGRSGFRFLPYSQFIQLLNRLNAVEGCSVDSLQGGVLFRNQILGRSTPYRVTSWEELASRIEEYNQQKYLEDLSIDEPIRQTLKSLHSGTQAVDDFFRIFDIGAGGEYVTKEETAAYLLAWICTRDDLDAAKTLLECWPSNIPTVGDYEEQKSRAKEAGSDIAADQWLKILPAAATRSRSEFRYVLGKYLSWVSVSKNVNRLFIRKAAVDLLRDAGDFHAAQFTEYNGYMSEGFSEIYRNNEQAVEWFEKAKYVANNTSGDWLSQIPEEGVRAFVHETIALAQKQYQNDDIDSASKLLEKRIDAIKNLTGIDESVIEDLTTKLEAEKFAIQAGKQLREGEFDIAKSSLGQAIKRYKHLGIEGPANYLITQKNQLRAFTSEQNSNFESAAQDYETIALTVEEQFGGDGDPYRARAAICRAKQAILNRQLTTARDELAPWKDKDRWFVTEVDKLATIINLLRDYDQKTVSDLTSVINTDQPDSGEGPLKTQYRTNYTDAITVISGAQRLAQLLETADWLDELVHVAVENALIPQLTSLQAMTDRAGTGSVSVIQDLTLESYRLQLLPRHVARKIEEAEMDRVTRTMDYTAAGDDLTKAIEFLLEVFAEYYGQLTWGEDWQSALTNNSTKPTLGDFIGVFQKESREHLRNPDTAKKLFEETVVNDKSLVQVRNDYPGHENEPAFDEKAYDELQEHVHKTVDHLIADTPIIAQITDKSEVGYFTAELYWNYSPKWIILQCTDDLNKDGYYYLPRGEVDGSIVKIKDEIVPCKSNRIRRHLQNI